MGDVILFFSVIPDLIRNPVFQKDHQLAIINGLIGDHE